jgi:hypothetical protein
MSDDTIRLSVEMRDVRERVTRIESKLDELNKAVLQFPRCPGAGACMQLMPRVDDQENRIRKVEDSLSQFRGAGTTLRFLWAAIGGTLVAGIVWLIQNAPKI